MQALGSKTHGHLRHALAEPARQQPAQQALEKQCHPAQQHQRGHPLGELRLALDQKEAARTQRERYEWHQAAIAPGQAAETTGHGALHKALDSAWSENFVSLAGHSVVHSQKRR